MHPELEELKRIKQEKGLTLDYLSRALNMQVSTIARWLRTGKINPFYAQYLKGQMGNLKGGLGDGKSTKNEAG